MKHEECLVELDEILKYLNDEDLSKIPYEIRTAINEKKDKQYNWNYDESKTLEEQNISRETIAMLSYLNMKYLLNEEQKKLMEELHKFNEEKIEKEKLKNYNPSNLFQKNAENGETENSGNMQMIIKNEEKWYQKVIKVIFKFFHKDKVD